MKHTHHNDPFEFDEYERDTSWIIVALGMGLMVVVCWVILLGALLVISEIAYV